MAGDPDLARAAGRKNLVCIFDGGNLSSQNLSSLECFAEYAAMRATRHDGRDPAPVAWLVPPDPAADRMREEGDSERGRRLLAAYGCGSCHVIPGIPAATGGVGPPLAAWRHREYIAGILVNEPGNLVTWIVSPQSVEPGTAMPDLGVSDSAALHMAAYLFSLD